MARVTAGLVWAGLTAGLVFAQPQNKPQITTADGNLHLTAPAAEVHIKSSTGTCTSGALCAAAMRTANSSGTVSPDGPGLSTMGTASISLGSMKMHDQPLVRLVMTGCAGEVYALSIEFFCNGTSVTAQVSSTRGPTVDAPSIEFSECVSLFADVSRGGEDTVAIRAVVDLARLAPNCTMFSYNVAATSVTGGFNSSFLFAGGAAVPMIRVATGEDIMSVNRATGVLSGQINQADQQISTLQSQLSGTEAALSRSQSALDAATRQIRSLMTLTADYNVLEDAINNITHCSGQGMLHTTDGQCVHSVPTCSRPRLPRNISLTYPGEAVPGTLGTLICPRGFYDTSGGITCLRNGSWTPPRPQCTRCPLHCTSCTGPNTCTNCTSGVTLAHGECQAGDGSSPTRAFLNCAMSRAAGQPSGVRWLLSARGRAYRAYCLNEDNTRGWGNVYGGGWEVVHTLIGGHNLPTTAVSNYNLRRRPNVPPNDYVDLPNIQNSGGRSTHRSRMGQSWGERASENGLQWMKFMVKIRGDSPQGQDTNLVQLPTNMNFNWFFSASRNGCQRMPGRIAISVNGRSMGSTDRAVQSSSNRGLANRDNDRCGQGSNNYITTNGRTSWRRIDGYTTDNSIRHLISYADTSTGLSSSRCTYCCWGCSGWREVVVWAVRPRS